nr:MAG TPA: hypothetical protein [Bacteriophage sp.]
MTSLIHKLIALNYHRRILFTEIFSYSQTIIIIRCYKPDSQAYRS